MALFELLSRRFALGSRLLFVFRQTGRLVICFVPIRAGRDRLRAFSGRFSVICLGWFTSSLCVYLRAIAAALAFDRRSAMQFCCGFAFGSRLLFILRQTGRLAAACVSVPPGRDRLRAFSGRSSVICFGWFTSGLCVYLRAIAAALAFDKRSAMRFCRGALPSVHACCLSFDKQDGLRYLAFLFRRVEIAFVRSRGVFRLSDLAGSLRVCAFICGDLDGVTEGRSYEGERGWRRGLCASLRSHIGTVMLSAGSTLGLRAPDCAKESSTLWTLLTLRRGCVGAYSRRRHPGIRKDPPGSNLWPGGSGCIKMLSTRSDVQTRAAPKRRGVGLHARSGVEAGTAGRVVLRGSKWKPALPA